MVTGCVRAGVRSARDVLAFAAVVFLSITDGWAQDAHHGGKSAAARPAGLGSSAAFAPDDALWLAGVDRNKRLFVLTSRDDGHRWSGPRTIDTAQDEVAADGDSRPKIAFGPNGQVAIAYTNPFDKPYTGRIRLLRSVDGGRSFAPPVTVHGDRQIVTHRFESIAFDRKGRLHVVWIDKRDAEEARRGAPAAAAKSAYAGAAVYRSVSKDGGLSFGPDTKLADHSCECCRIALVADADGALVALWRHVFAPNIRDHAFARFGALNVAPVAPVRATFDDWAIDACPHHGPGLAAAAAGGYHAVWFGERAGQPAVRYSRLGSDGRPVGATQVLPDEQAEHADVLSAGARVVIAWRSFDGKTTRLRAWVSEDDGRHFMLRELASDTGDNDHPRLASDGARILAVWRTTKDVHVINVAP